MATLYVDRKNVRLVADGEALAFYENDERVGTVPLAPLQRVFLRGNATLDVSVLGRLGAHGIGVIILSGRKAEPTLFLPRPHNDAARRLAQYRTALEVEACLRIARRMVQNKFLAQVRFIQARLEARPEVRYELTRALRALLGMSSQVQHSADVAALRGLEGAAANAYFAALVALAPPGIRFSGRNRRPPRDPLNAVLSLGYTLLHAEAVLAVHAVGLDPCLGFYHAPLFGRESLACDVVEGFRPQVDAWAMRLFNEQTLRAEDFSTTQDGCFLGKAGRERFYRAWEPLAEGLRKGLDEEARALLGLIGAPDEAVQAAPADDFEAWEGTATSMGHAA